MLSALDRKLVRDVVHMRGQLAAVALVVACGIAVLVMVCSIDESTMTSIMAAVRIAPIPPA